ncbi:MAG TPA: hypothetical protein VH763_18465, partial [Gemmatimonadales bacterium]
VVRNTPRIRRRTATVSTPPPLTEGVLQRLGRPRWLWVALWVRSAGGPSVSVHSRKTAASGSGPSEDAPARTVAGAGRGGDATDHGGLVS